MHRVDVKRWVVDDVVAALRARNPLFRPVLGRVLSELHSHLPGAMAFYQTNRIAGSPRCFWYERIYVNGGRLLFLSFAVLDANPGVLEVIWVIPTE